MDNKILYFCALENTVNNNIHSNQVYPVIENTENMCGLFLNPFFEISRSKIGIIKMKKNISKSHVHFIPFPTFLFFCPWFIFPILFFYCFIYLFIFCLIKNIKIVHARNTLSAIVAVSVSKILNIKVLSDIRGVYPDEGVLLGRWKLDSLSYKFFKYLESYVFRGTHKICGISPELCSYIYKYSSEIHPRFVPAIVDSKFIYFDKDLYKKTRSVLKIKDDEYCFIYVGSIGAWNKVSELNSQVKYLCKKNKIVESKAHLLILTNAKQEIIRKELQLNCNLIIKSVEPHRVNDFLNAADYGLLPGKKIVNKADLIVFGVMISSKAQEYMVTGLNVIANPKIKFFSSNEFKNIQKLERLARAQSCHNMFTLEYVISQYKILYEDMM